MHYKIRKCILLKTYKTFSIQTKSMEHFRGPTHDLATLQTTTHELRTPLAIILSYTQLLEQQIYGPLTSQQAIALEKIEQSARILMKAINERLIEIEAQVPTYH